MSWGIKTKECKVHFTAKSHLLENPGKGTVDILTAVASSIGRDEGGHPGPTRQ